MVALVPKTRYDELLEELEEIESAPRQQALQRLAFFSNKLNSSNKKNVLGTQEHIYLKARIAAVKANSGELRTYTSGLCSLAGVQGCWLQFENFLYFGYLHDAYCIIKEIQVEGCELTNASWLCLAHSLNGDFVRAQECYKYIKRAYPRTDKAAHVQLVMADTAMEIAQELSMYENSFSITKAIQQAFSSAVPVEMLRVPGVRYRSANTLTPEGTQFLIDLEVMPNDESIADLTEISRGFSHTLQNLLPADITDKIIICLSYSDDTHND